MTSATSMYNAKPVLADSNKEFEQWSLQSRLPQLRYMVFFTALLYLLYGYFETLIDLPYANQRLLFHVVIIPLSLLLIYRLSFYPQYFKQMRLLLVFAPVSAVWANLYLNVGSSSFSHFSPEIYLNIIWTFTMSGLTFRYALFAVCCSLSGTLVMSYLHGPNDPKLYLHYLWILSACVFGVVSSIVLERMMRSLYQQQLELAHSASVDGLTGLWNREKLLQLFNQTLDEASSRAGYSILMLDIDHFKPVNDQFGHIVGDKVLVQFSQLLKQQVHKLGHVGRFGGEEFCILLPHYTLHQAEQFAEHLRVKISETAFETVGVKTASIGVCQYVPNESFETLITRADKALYMAKDKGRNRVQSLN